jgi:hypothetical protein
MKVEPRTILNSEAEFAYVPFGWEVPPAPRPVRALTEFIRSLKPGETLAKNFIYRGARKYEPRNSKTFIWFQCPCSPNYILRGLPALTQKPYALERLNPCVNCNSIAVYKAQKALDFYLNGLDESTKELFSLALQRSSFYLPEEGFENIDFFTDKGPLQKLLGLKSEDDAMRSPQPLIYLDLQACGNNLEKAVEEGLSQWDICKDICQQAGISSKQKTITGAEMFYLLADKKNPDALGFESRQNKLWAATPRGKRNIPAPWLKNPTHWS